MLGASKFREQNRVVDALAKTSVQQKNFGDPDFLKVLPTCAHLLLQADIVETTFARKINSTIISSQGQGVTQTISNSQTLAIVERVVLS